MCKSLKSLLFVYLREDVDERLDMVMSDGVFNESLLFVFDFVEKLRWIEFREVIVMRFLFLEEIVDIRVFV